MYEIPVSFYKKKFAILFYLFELIYQANVVSRQVQGGVFNKPLLPVGVGIMAGEGEKGWIVARYFSFTISTFDTKY